MKRSQTALERSFQKAGITVATGAKLEQVAVDGGAGKRSTCLEGQEPQPVSADYLLVAVGVSGNCDGLGLEHAGVETFTGVYRDGRRMQNLRQPYFCHRRCPWGHAACSQGFG